MMNITLAIIHALEKQTGINYDKCQMSVDHPPPGGVAQCVGSGWSYVHVGGNDDDDDVDYDDNIQ